MKRKVHLRPIADILKELGACKIGVAEVAKFGTDYALAWKNTRIGLRRWLADLIAGERCHCMPNCQFASPTGRSVALASAPWPKMKAALVAYGIDFVDRKGWRAHPCGIGTARRLGLGSGGLRL